MLIGKTVRGYVIRRWHVLAVSGLVALILLGLAGALLPGAGLRWGLVKVLRDLGMVEVSVSDADLSLFGGKVVVRQMVARPALGSALGIKDFALRFRWAPLLNKRIVVDRIALEGVDVVVSRNPETGGLVINGLPLAVAAAPPPKDGGEAEAPPSWGIDVASLELTNSRLLLEDGETRADITLNRLVVENLHSRSPRVPVTYRLEGSLNGSAIELSGGVTPFDVEPNVTLTARLAGFDLGTLGPLLAGSGIRGLGGKADLALSAEGSLKESGLVATASGRLDLADFRLAHPAELSATRLGLDLRHASWDGKRLDLSAAAEGGGLSVKTAEAKASLGGAKLDARSLVWDNGRLHLDAGLQAQTVAGSGPGGEGSAAGLTLDARPLVWDGRLGWQGALALTGAVITLADGTVRPDQASWAGKLDFDPAGPAGRAEGKLDLAGLRLVRPDLEAMLATAGAEGWVAFGDKSKATAKLGFTAQGLSGRDPRNGMELVRLERLEAVDLTLDDQGAVAATRLGLDGLAALRREGKSGYPWRIEAKSVRLGHPGRDAEGDFAVAEARIDGLTARVTRTKTGIVGFEPAKPQPAAAAPQESPDITLGRLVVAGGSRVLFEDHSLGESVRLDIWPLELSLSDLDSDHPDRDSPFEIKAEIGEAKIALKGVVRPFADDIGGRVEGRITAFELPPLSPYLAEALGVQIQTGHFDGSLDGTAAKGTLNGKLDIALSKLFIAPPDPNAPLARKAEMPIETVLDLLRGEDDRIHLSLPVRGNLANPDFDVSDAVAQAVAGALRSTVMTTLKIAFPVAGLLSLVIDANDRQRLGLAPLVFAPGSALLDDGHRKTLTGVGELMKGRPGLHLTLCGKADTGDWAPLAEARRAEDKPLLSKLEKFVGVQRKAEDFGAPDRDALADLAARRAAAAKEYLADEAGIDASRLYECRVEVETVAKGPRVELLL